MYSPGLENVVAGETAVSTIADGLSYRGYTIESLAEHATFDEVAYLLLHGELPNAAELAGFCDRVGAAAQVAEPIIDFVRQVPPSAPAMDVLRSAASMVAHWDAEIADNSRAANLRKAERLLAQLPVVMAARHRLLDGMEPLPRDPRQSFAESVLTMLFREKPTPGAVKALDVSLILYAEHEFNASTFTARVVASTLSDLHSSIVAAIGALKGPLHGGANERVMEVLESVGSPDKAEAWVRDALAKKVRIMGFGHRVYKDDRDPRATFLKPLCAALAEETNKQSLEQMADTIEQIVWQEKKLPPNADWPSARLYHYLGLPVPLYTPLFVISRVTGWSAHVMEQLENNRLMRPRSLYAGPANRAWVPIADR